MKLKEAILTFAFVVAAAGCGSGADKSAEASAQAEARLTTIETLSAYGWCRTNSGEEHRQTIFQPDGTLIVAYYKSMSPENKPSDLIEAVPGRWQLNGEELQIEVKNESLTYKKIVFVEDLGGKGLKLYDDQDLFTYNYECAIDADLSSGLQVTQQ